MNKKMKTIWRIIIISIIAGIVLSVLGFILGAGRTLYLDRAGFHVSGGESTQISEHNLPSFRYISIDGGIGDVELVQSDNYGIDINSHETEWFYNIENETLVISHTRNQRVQIMNFDFLSAERNYARVYIPADAILETVAIQTSSGYINAGNFQAKSVEVNSSTGRVQLYNLVGDNLKVSTTSGDIRLSGEFLGVSSINTRSGDVRLTTSGIRHDYSLDISTRTGSINIDGERVRNETTVINNPILPNHIRIATTSGNINLGFVG